MKFIGNQSVIFQLEIAAKASRSQRRPLPHILFTGSAGCGKTTVANYVATLMDVKLLNISPVGVGNTHLFVKALIHHAKKYKRFPIVFIDEVHHVTAKDQELLGVLMEQFMVPLRVGNSEQEVSVKVPPFTCIGATTNTGTLLKPFYDRFKLVFVFRTYTNKESIEIAKLHSQRLEINPTEQQFEIIAEAGRFTPRLIVSILERYRDFSIALVNGDKTLSDDLFNKMLFVMGIREDGLKTEDIELLQILEKQDSAIGLETLCLLLNESPGTIRNTVEPYLLQKHMIARTPRGRVITDKGLEYLYNNGYAERDKDLNVMDFDFLE